MLEVGESLSGRYRIERILGKGGMGAVYLGVMDSLGGKKFAIKEMEFAGGGHRTREQAVEQFRREASFLANLDHPNLVRVTDFFAEGDKHYLVMAYIEGQTLQQRIEEMQRPLDWTELKPRIDDLLEVLDYLHKQDPPIIFRDLKPANIMMESSGQLKLIDFGIARTAQPGQETSTFLRGTGTSGFSPIEQYGMGESTDQRSDIYSFGATVYYLLTGKVPPDAVQRVSSGKPLEPPSWWNPNVPVYLDGIILKCLGVRQNERYKNVEAIRRELNLVLDICVEVPDTEDLSLYSENQRLVPGSASSNSPLIALLTSLVCLVAMFGLAYYWDEILQGLQPAEAVAQVESVEEKDLRPEPKAVAVEKEETEPPKPKERDPYAYIPKIPVKPVAAPQPQPQVKSRPATETYAPPRPKPQPAKPKPHFDIGNQNYPQAPVKSQEPSSAPPEFSEEPIFYETLPSGRKVRLNPNDPRLPLLRKQWRQRLQGQQSTPH